MSRSIRKVGLWLTVLVLLVGCSRQSEPPTPPAATQKPKPAPIAQGMSDREELRYTVTIEAEDPGYALKRLKALPDGFTQNEQKRALSLTRDNPLDIERAHYLDFLRILQELGALQVEKQSFITKEPATAPIPFVLRLKQAPKAQKTAPSSPDSRSRRAP